MAKLQVLKDNETIQEIDLVSSIEYIGGRQSGTDIPLEGLPGISRQHFKIYFDGTGWKVECLSSVKITEFNGIESQTFDLSGPCSFSLSPYRFVYIPDGAELNQSLSQEPGIPEATDPTENIGFEDSDQGIQATPGSEGFSKGEDDTDVSPPPLPDYESSDEATSIQTFQGSPYLKIMGSGKRKTEYYRLEGHLWVAGSDTNAAIFLPEGKAAAAQFEISKLEKGFQIIDLGSPTGTLVNGQHISTSSKTDLSSGDLINVGNLTLQFELRDQSFKEKVKNIPLHMYENPLVFFGQDAGVLDTGPEKTKKRKVEEISRFDQTEPRKNKKKTLMIYAAVIMVLVAGLTSLEQKTDVKSKQPVQNLDPFQKLTKQNQKIVKDTYNLAKKLYLNAQFELALRQLTNLHRILDIGYLDSKQIEEYCINSRDLKQQKAEIERQRREQRQLQLRVQRVLAQCSQRFENSVDLEPARICLSDAIQLDPSNPEINELLSKIAARIEVKATNKKVARNKEELARRGRNLYLKAKALHDGKDFIGAIEAFESHINSGLPDPRGLVRQSKRKLSSIQKYILQKKKTLVASAQGELSAANLKKAILLARQAADVDPYDREIASFLRKIEKELTTKMKNIYMDSVIEERFGNIDASKEKWNQIIAADVKGGEYYKKARRKLKLYGF